MAQIKQHYWQKSLRFIPDEKDYDTVSRMLGGEPPLLRVSFCRNAERVVNGVIDRLINSK